MKLSTRYIILCLFTLSSAFGRAEKVVHEFPKMNKNGTLTLQDSQKTGVTDFCICTCSNNAQFSADYGLTAANLAIFLDPKDAKVETTLISGLDSLVIHYYPNEAKDVLIYIKEEDGAWQDVTTLVNKAVGVNNVKLPYPGNYQVRIKCKSNTNKVYVWKIEYFYVDLSDCPNCFLYRPE